MKQKLNDGWNNALKGLGDKRDATTNTRYLYYFGTYR